MRIRLRNKVRMYRDRHVKIAPLGPARPEFNISTFCPPLYDYVSESSPPHMHLSEHVSSLAVCDGAARHGTARRTSQCPHAQRRVCDVSATKLLYGLL